MVIIDGRKRASSDLIEPGKYEICFYYITDELWWHAEPYNVLERVLDEISSSASYNVLYDIRRTDVNPQTVKAFCDNYKISLLPALVITPEDIVEGLRVRKIEASEVIPKEILWNLCRIGKEEKLKNFFVEMLQLNKKGELNLGRRNFWENIRRIGLRIFEESWEKVVTPVIAEYLRRLSIG